jgi:chromosome segregation ATPase
LEDVSSFACSFPYFSAGWRSVFLRTGFARFKLCRRSGTTSVFDANPDSDSEIEKMQKLLEYQAAEIKQKDAENLNLKFEGVKKEIRTSTEGLKKDIDALKKDLDTSTEGLKTAIDTSTEGLKKDINEVKKDIDELKNGIKGLDTKFDTLSIIIIVIGCATFLEKYPSLLASFLKK